MASVVRTSCAAFMSRSACVATLHSDKIAEFLKGIDRQHYEKILRSEKAQMTFPLHFTSEHQRLNFYSILHLLNFGSGFRVILKAANGSGAFDNIIKLLISAHISGKALDAAWMRNVSATEVAEMMHLSMIVEIPVKDRPALYEVKPSPVSTLVHKIAAALNSTGQALAQLGPDAWLIDYVKRSIQESDDIDALLSRMARLPVLDDHVILDDGTKVCIYKKSQVMLSELKRNGLSMPCVKDGDLTIFSDNVIPTMLNHFGLISCPSADIALQSDLELTPLQALSVRAASIVICQEIVRTATSLDMPWIGNEVDLDNYLWKVAKDAKYRSLPRFVDRDTWFY